MQARIEDLDSRREPGNFVATARRLILLLVLLPVAAEATEPHWVHGSWVNLRSAASPQGAVIARLTTNTQVYLLARQGEWCKVASRLPQASGFMACSLLGSQPLSLADVGTPPKYGDRGNSRYSPPRAFWLAPSVLRLQAAGNYFWSTMLNASQKKSEQPFSGAYPQDNEPQFDWDKRPTPVRFPIPEFDAMKELMATGVVAAPERRPRMIRWSALKNAAAGKRGESAAAAEMWLDEDVSSLIRQAQPRAVTTSLFRRIEDLAPRSASVEEISAQFGIRERLRVLGGPTWVQSRNDNPHVQGIWDIGSFEIILEKPVIEYVVGRQGLASANEWAASEMDGLGAESTCAGGLDISRRAAHPLPGYPLVKDPLVWFYVPTALPYKKVKIKRLAKRIDTPLDSNGFSRDSALRLLVIHEVDLDDDGVADLSVWEGMRPMARPEDVVAIRIVFANINGEWYVFDTDRYTECS